MIKVVVLVVVELEVVVVKVVVGHYLYCLLQTLNTEQLILLILEAVLSDLNVDWQELKNNYTYVKTGQFIYCAVFSLK